MTNILTLSEPPAAAMTMRRPRRRRRGVTILEAVLWAGILVIVIGGLVTVFQVVNNNLRENRTVQISQQVVAGVRGLYVNSRNYTGLTGAILINTGDIPSSAISGTNIISAEDATITLNGGQGWWSMHIPTTRAGTCIALLSAFQGDGAVKANLLASSGTAGTQPTVAATPTTTGAISTTCAGTSPPNVGLLFD